MALSLHSSPFYFLRAGHQPQPRGSRYPGFQVGPTFPIFLLFPTFLICSYFSLLFHENALLSLLFHSKMSFTPKNPEIFPRSLCSLRYYK